MCSPWERTANAQKKTENIGVAKGPSSVLPLLWDPILGRNIVLLLFFWKKNTARNKTKTLYRIYQSTRLPHVSCFYCSVLSFQSLVAFFALRVDWQSYMTKHKQTLIVRKGIHNISRLQSQVVHKRRAISSSNTANKCNIQFCTVELQCSV